MPNHLLFMTERSSARYDCTSCTITHSRIRPRQVNQNVRRPLAFQRHSCGYVVVGILSWLLFGLIAGALAKFIMPGLSGLAPTGERCLVTVNCKDK
jgi:hypothetical protein